MLHKNQLVILSSKSKIIDVMEEMNNIGSQIALLLRDDESLHGIVTEGDIRRSLIKGFEKTDFVAEIMNTSPKTVNIGMPINDVVKLISDKYKSIPVLSDDMRVIGLYNSDDFSVLIDAKSRSVCVLGMGYVGLTLSLVMADVGFKVFGYDINKELIEKLLNGKLSFFEDGIDNYLNKYINNGLTPTSNLNSVEADTYIVTVGTPIDDATRIPNINYIKEAIKSIAPFIKKNDLIILRSTVPVGTTRKIVLPILRESVNLEPGIDYFLAFAPERTVEGDALNECRELPQIVGGYDAKSSLLTQQLFKEITHTIIEVDNLESAEMVKIMNNTFRDVKFAYSNEMALICRDLGLDMVNLVNAANMGYTRDKIPTPSPGVGGPCLTKDSYILINSTEHIKSHPRIVEASRKVNESIPLVLVDEIIQKIDILKKNISNSKFFIIGFAFKGNPETSDMRGSTTLDLISEIRMKKANNKYIFGYDFVVDSSAIEALDINYSSIQSGFNNADVVIIMNNHQSTKKIDIFSLLKTSKEDLIFVDGWHTFNPNDITNGNKINYIGVGC
jgi:UDP-N-acetyl-D-mannosaminuronic acid dehydrogenase